MGGKINYETSVKPCMGERVCEIGGRAELRISNKYGPKNEEKKEQLHFRT